MRELNTPFGAVPVVEGKWVKVQDSWCARVPMLAPVKEGSVIHLQNSKGHISVVFARELVAPYTWRVGAYREVYDYYSDGDYDDPLMAFDPEF